MGGWEGGVSVLLSSFLSFVRSFFRSFLSPLFSFSVDEVHDFSFSFLLFSLSIIVMMVSSLTLSLSLPSAHRRNEASRPAPESVGFLRRVSTRA